MSPRVTLLPSAKDAVQDQEPIRSLWPFVLRFREVKLLALWSTPSLAAAAWTAGRRPAGHAEFGAELPHRRASGALTRPAFQFLLNPR